MTVFNGGGDEGRVSVRVVNDTLRINCKCTGNIFRTDGGASPGGSAAPACNKLSIQCEWDSTNHHYLSNSSGNQGYGIAE